jgi:hypothetical protein
VILSNTHRVHFPEAGGQSGHPLTACQATFSAARSHKGATNM